MRCSQGAGQAVRHVWLRISMKRLIRQHYGDEAANAFKASRQWLHQFARRVGISLRRKSNASQWPPPLRQSGGPAAVAGL